MFTSEDNDKSRQSVIRDELMKILKECAKEKILGLDGWGLEFFIHFIDLMILYLLVIAE